MNKKHILYILIIILISLILLNGYFKVLYGKSQKEILNQTELLNLENETSLEEAIYFREIKECRTFKEYTAKQEKDCNELSKIDFFMDNDLKPHFGQGKSYEE